MKIRYLFACLLLLLIPREMPAGELPSEQRIVFLGDSITQSGRYIEIVEAAILTQHPGVKKTIIPLGLSSETVSGLSEPGHAGGQFPRPTVHERLDRVLEKTKPQLVLACYGMNDGIYYPLNKERTEAFQQGMNLLHDKVTAAGARIIHLTPPVFDPLPIKSRTLPAGLDKYEKPFEGYNQVLDAYSAWLLEMRTAKQWNVLDVHGPMNAALAEKRKTNPKFTFANDGVHPTPEGQMIIAKVLLEAWGLKAKPDGTPEHAHGKEILDLVHKKQDLLRYAWLSHAGHKRPGVPKGLPVAEAEAKAATIDAEIQKLLK